MKIRVIILMFCFSASLLPFLVFAAGFNPNFVLSDRDLVNFQSMTADDVQRFVEGKGGTLGAYQATDLDGRVKRAADIIYRVAQQFLVSPKFLLGMLQKEQSLVTDPTPKDTQYNWATGYGVCDGCSVANGAITKYKGFAKQLDSMAQQYRFGYLADLESKGTTSTNLGVGRTAMIDSVAVIPQNNATAAMYTYTPHLEGNRNFWNIWRDWFGTVSYPTGTILKDATTNEYWRIKAGRRQFIPSLSVLASIGDPNLTIVVDSATITAFEATIPLAFPNFSLVRDERGDVFLLVNEEKRRFQNLDDLKRFGYVEDEILTATSADLASYKDGSVITYQTSYPQGAVVEDATTKQKYFVDNGKRSAILSADILAVRFPSWRVRSMKHEEVAGLLEDAPVLYPDGTLMKVATDPTVYVISEGKRRPITDEKTFLGLGYRWETIKTVPSSVVEIHQPGSLVTLE